jgi:thiol-disulfide isomerase/thioredoxin
MAVPQSFAAELGSAAPPLQIKEWVKGEPVTIGAGDNVYVVEFWATWCGPCRTSIPHLTELQKKYKDKGVVVVGISNETAEEVRPFVTEMGATMDYRVAIDNNEQTNDQYMKAFNQQGIPTAFVVDKTAKIVWVGHPMAELDEVLDEVVAGTFSIEKSKQRAERRKQLMEDYRQFATSLRTGEVEKAHSLAEAAVKNYADEPSYLNEVAWVLLTFENRKFHNYPLALRIAKVAVESSKSKDASILDTYARALFETGDVAGAIAQQEKAVALVSDPDEREPLEQTLKNYKAAGAKTQAPQ